jgi:hypothetical protein
MASLAEKLAQEAREHSLILRTEFDILKQQVEKHDLAQLRERLAVLEDRTGKLAEQVEQLKPTKAESEEMGAIKNRITQLEEQKKLTDTRLFQFYMLFAGGVITLTVQVAILFLKK